MNAKPCVLSVSLMPLQTSGGLRTKGIFLASRCPYRSSARWTTSSTLKSKTPSVTAAILTAQSVGKVPTYICRSEIT